VCDVRRLLILIWLMLIADTVFFAPSELPSPLEMGWRLVVFDWPEPGLVALYYATGIILFMHAAFLLAETRQSKPHALPVLLVSPLFGSFIMLPFYALRRRGPARVPSRLPWRLLRYLLLGELVAAALYATLVGNLGALWHDITHRRFSHVLLVDFVLLSLLLLLLIAGKLAPPGPAESDAAAPSQA
jgi:hypothetical protein